MVDIKKVIENLKQVYDPEMPSINVYDLGLIYEVSAIDDETVKIRHTLTSPMCPFAEEIISMIHEAGMTGTGATSCEIDLTFTPPFTMEMVPDETRAMMGWFIDEE